MEELIEKVENLKRTLNQEKTVIDLKVLNKEIKSDEKLMELLTKYHNDPSEKIKSKIIQNEKFRKYKEKETDLNLLIFEINSKLKKITKKGKCSL